MAPKDSENSLLAIFELESALNDCLLNLVAVCEAIKKKNRPLSDEDFELLIHVSGIAHNLLEFPKRNPVYKNWLVELQQKTMQLRDLFTESRLPLTQAIDAMARFLKATKNKA